MKLVLVTGGVRSGKSGFAEELACQTGDQVLYIATGVNTDSEMEERIRVHRERRPDSWSCLEAPYDLPLTLDTYTPYPVILFDCFSTWVTNQMMQIPEEELGQRKWTETILSRVNEWLQIMSDYPGVVIGVTSEVGLGGVAMSPLGRWFQDVQGSVNQQLAREAAEVYMVVSGIPWKIKGEQSL